MHRRIVRLVAVVALHVSKPVIPQRRVGRSVELGGFFRAVEGVDPFLDGDSRRSVACLFRLFEYVPFVALGSISRVSVEYTRNLQYPQSTTNAPSCPLCSDIARQAQAARCPVSAAYLPHQQPRQRYGPTM